jgi:hypothetical protein
MGYACGSLDSKEEWKINTIEYVRLYYSQNSIEEI